jgi:hypothetical protein
MWQHVGKHLLNFILGTSLDHILDWYEMEKSDNDYVSDAKLQSIRAKRATFMKK